MDELNPHRQIARIFAFVCYVLAGLMLGVGAFFTIASAMMDTSKFRLEGETNQGMATMMGSMFAIITLIVALFGWRVQKLFGQQRRNDKAAAKCAVGCLRLGSLGCALWILPSTLSMLMTGKMLSTNQPVGAREIFVGISGSIFATLFMLAIAWFISANFARLNSEDRQRAYRAYQDAIRPYLTRLAEPGARTSVQERTMDVLEKLDTSLKASLLVFLGQSGLLSGDTRLTLQDADFRCVDLSSINLPRADLRGINLGQAVLRDAILFKANLQGAKLTNADLTRANLQEADIRQANLTGAVLEDTDLSDANLTGTRLTPEQRNQARLTETFS
jgi:uncharacterized protein YjbI with pentapeptide repeats